MKHLLIRGMFLITILFGMAQTTLADIVFEYQDGAFTTINAPLAVSGINNSGQIVGYNAGEGFLYSGGTLTPIDVPGSVQTRADGINDNGQIVGWYDNGVTSYGFEYSDGAFTTIAVPGAQYTFAEGINNLGQIGGILHGWHGHTRV
jgi:probable HAF family extracellular repeat protein